MKYMPAGKIVLAAPRRPTKKTTKSVVTYGAMKSYVDRNIENKFIYGYMSTTFTSIANTWLELDLLNGLSQGGNLNQRIGNAVRIKSIAFRGMLVQGSSQTIADDAHNTVRVVCCKAETSVLTPMATAGYTINSFMLANSGFTGLKKVYMDKLIGLPVTGQASAGYTPSMRVVKFFKRFKNPWKVTWSSNLGGSNNYRIFLSMISDSAAVPNPGITIGNWKVVFEDS